MEFEYFVNWAFMAIMSGAVIYGVSILTKLNSSIQELNVTVAQMLVKHEFHDKEIDEMKKDIHFIQKQLIN